jgi:RNA recognition motif-containing protein
MNTKTRLLFSDVPVSCSEDQLTRWIEAKGFEVASVKLVRDVVSGTSPSFAHVQLKDLVKVAEAARTLDGQLLRGRVIQVSQIDPLPDAKPRRQQAQRLPRV